MYVHTFERLYISLEGKREHCVYIYIFIFKIFFKYFFLTVSITRDKKEMK